MKSQILVKVDCYAFYLFFNQIIYLKVIEFIKMLYSDNVNSYKYDGRSFLKLLITKL